MLKYGVIMKVLERKQEKKIKPVFVKELIIINSDIIIFIFV